MATFAPILRALNEGAVRYVVVGGVGVVIRGHPRFTADLDLVIDLDPPEALKAIRALSGLGLQPTVPVRAEDFADPAIRRRWIEEKNLFVFSMVDPDDLLRHVDVFVEYPIDFEDLWSRSDVLDLDGISVRTASIEHLIEMKRVAGRAKDAEDIDALRALIEDGADG